MSAPVVVTGLGVTAPNGLGVEAYWSAIRNGVSGLGRVTRFDPARYPVTLAGEITDFDVKEHLPSRLVPTTDRMTQLALVASDWALADAAITPKELADFDSGVITAASSGGYEFGQRELENLWSKGSKYVSAYQSYAWFYAVNTGQISIRHGMRGASGVVVSDQAGGLDALAQARRQIRKGTRLVLSGGIDGSICPWGWVAQMAGDRMSRSADPDRAYLPFDRNAGGYVSGEGGAILVLEPAGAAHERGAAVYGELAGYASTLDPKPGSGRPPGLRKAIELALADAELTAADVDVVFADAAADRELDRIEAEAIVAVFGPGGVPVTAPKVLTGRLYSGAGSLDVVTALLSIRDDVIPPTVGVVRGAEYDIDLVTEVARPAVMYTALVLGRGHGGFNSALILRG